MKFNVYAVLDKRVKAYNAALIVKTETPEQVSEICRLGYLTLPVDKRESYLDLYQVGIFDTKTGVMAPLAVPELVCSNSAFEEEVKDV